MEKKVVMVHTTSDPQEFMSWFPEVTTKLFAHVTVKRIEMTVGGGTEDGEAVFIYENKQY